MTGLMTGLNWPELARTGLSLVGATGARVLVF